MSKDSPTQYHTRTLDLFFKSYFAGYPSLNEAADVIFSANNLDNHNLITPSIIYDIEEYLAKAKIHSYGKGSRAEQSHMFSERGVASKGVGEKHAHEATKIFNFEDWSGAKPDDKDSAEVAQTKTANRRKMAQRFLGWQMQTQPREGTSPDENPHPVHNMNMFHEGKSSSSGASSMLMQYVTQMFLFETDGESNCELVDKAMNDMGVTPKLAHTNNMGEWSNSHNEASFTKQIDDCIDRFENEYKERLGKEPDNEGLANKAIQMKMWQLRGVPKDVAWDILCDEDGWKRGDDYMDATKTLGLITQDPQNAQYKAGFFALYLGIPLLEYEDQLKVCEWFLDGAGNAGDGKKHNDFDDKVINRILGHNARGFLTRSTQGFANALHAKYTGNPSTTGHNSLVAGKRSRSESHHGVGGNNQFFNRLRPYDKATDSRSIDVKVLNGLDIDSNQYNELLGSIESSEDESKTLLDVIGKVDAEDLPFDELIPFEQKLSKDDTKNFARAIAIEYGPRGTILDDEDLFANVKFLFKLKDNDFSPSGDDPEVDKTMLYYFTHALGGLEGAMGEDWSHWQDLFLEAFPNVFVSNTDTFEDKNESEERILPSSKREYELSRRIKPAKFENYFQRDVNDDRITAVGKRNDLKRALKNSNMPEDDEYYLDLYDKDNPGNKQPNQISVEYSQGEGSQEEYMLEQLGDTSVDDYVGGYEPTSTPVSLGQSAIITPMLVSNSDYGNPNHHSADVQNQHIGKVEPHTSPMATIKAMRHQAIIRAEQKNAKNIAGKTTGSARAETRGTVANTFSADVRNREKDNESIHAREVSEEDAHNRMMMLHTLLFQAHHGPDNYNEKDHNTHNQKQDSIKSVYDSHHRDPLGRGAGAGSLYQHELLSDGENSNLAIYDAEDFNNRHRENMVVPKPIRSNIENRHQLLNELTSLSPNKPSFHHDSEGVSYDEMGSSVKEMAEKNIKAGRGGYYKDADGEIKQYIVAPIPRVLYQDSMRHLRQSALDLARDGKTELAEIQERKTQELQKLIENDIGEEPSLNEDELRDKYLMDARDGHQQAVVASQIFRPLVEWANPDIFKTHTPELNNQAWADTGAFAHLCESFMRNLNPKQREHFLRNGKVHAPHRGEPKSVKDILTAHFKKQGVPEEEIEERIYGKTDSLLSDITGSAMRHTWTGDKNRGQTDENFGKDGDNSIYHLMEKYANGELDKKKYPPATSAKGRGVINHNDVVKKIFEKVREELPKNASLGRVLKKLHARYIPHRIEDGSSILEDTRPQHLVEYGKGTGRMNEDTGDWKGGVYNYKALTGGHHENNPVASNQNVMSGGGEALKPDGKPYSMYQELKSIDALWHHLQQVTKGTSHGIRTGGGSKAGRGLSDRLLTPKDKNWIHSLGNRMENFINHLGEDTQAVKVSTKQLNNLGSVKTGGMDIDTLQFPAVHTCPVANDKFGHITRPQHTYRTEHLPQGRLMIDTKRMDGHGGRDRYKRALDPYTMRDFTPNLERYDSSVDGNTQYPPVALEQSGVPGENVNANYNVFAGATSANDIVKRDFDHLTDDTLIFKTDGRPIPIKSMHRIFDLEDLKHLRGFSGDWIASHIPQGEPITLQKKGERVKAYNANMKLVELTDDMKDEMSKVNDKDFVVHAVIDEEKIYFIDLLEAADEKTHNMPAKDRVRHLRAHFESSEHIKMPEPYNTKRADDEGLEEAVHLLREESPSDILLRDASTTYMRGEIRHPKWVLLSKEKKVDVIILDRKGMNYRIGVGPIMHPEHYASRAVEIDGEHYMDVGSAKGPRGYDKGEYVSVFCTGVTQSGKENPTYKIRSARIDRDAHPQATDSVETLSIMGGDSMIPHRVSLNKGFIHIQFPALDDEVIYKVDRENEGWMVTPQNTLWGDGDDYFFKLSEDMRPYWSPLAILLLKSKEEREVKPEVPAGHTKKRKEVLPEEEEIIKRGLEVLERGLEQLSKEKITSTGVEGLGINYAGADVESPRGPTTNMTDDTNLDFNPEEREYKEKPATSKKKETRIRTTAGEEGITDNRGNVTITKPRV